MTSPERSRVLGVPVDRTDYAEVVARTLEHARARRPFLVACANVHLVMEARANAELAATLEAYDLVVPDGQPLRWALAADAPLLSDRVYGPELMRRLCLAAAAEGVGVYLYGGTAETIGALRASLARLAPGLAIAGAEAPPFGEALFADGPGAAERIRTSGAGIAFVGVGCPRQELWVGAYGSATSVPCIAVGAAFDLWAGRKKMAPAALQRWGLEWVFRFATEPRTRERYLRHNAPFALLGALEAARKLARRGVGARPAR